MNALTLDGARKDFGPVRAVDGIDLTVGAGQTVALLGPNGAGKTTTINLLLGLARPDSGRIEVFGHSPRGAVERGLVGAMLQDGALPVGLTVKEVVGFVRGLYPEPPPLSELLEVAGLAELAGRRVDRLSGGQAQRVRFALAAAGGPRLLVLDEPTAAMDVASRREFWSAMRGYAATGRTVLFSTHYLEEADDHADRVVVLAAGRVIADGSAAQIKARAGGRSVRFTLDGQPAATLYQLPGVTDVLLRGGSAQLLTEDADATVAALYRRTDLRIRDIEVKCAALEDAFLNLTRTLEGV